MRFADLVASAFCIESFKVFWLIIIRPFPRIAFGAMMNFSRAIGLVGVFFKQARETDVNLGVFRVRKRGIIPS